MIPFVIVLCCWSLLVAFALVVALDVGATWYWGGWQFWERWARNRRVRAPVPAPLSGGTYRTPPTAEP